MAQLLIDTHHAATTARADKLDLAALAGLRNRYIGARTLIDRFHRYQDMILRFATDLTVPFTNNEAAQ